MSKMRLGVRRTVSPPLAERDPSLPHFVIPVPRHGNPGSDVHLFDLETRPRTRGRSC